MMKLEMQVDVLHTCFKFPGSMPGNEFTHGRTWEARVSGVTLPVWSLGAIEDIP